MLYKQLRRITELDKQIHDMHLRLAEYYRERAALTSTPTAPEILTQPVQITDPAAVYETLQASWQLHGLTLPTYKTLAKRLSAATEIIDALTTENRQLAGNLTVIAVPPQSHIDKLIKQGTPPHSYVFTEEFLGNAPKRATRWEIIIVTGAGFALSIDALNESLGQAEFTYKQWDCRGLGIREAIAADILGLEVVTANNWTLLLKDAADLSHIPCVTKQDNQLIFDIDDARCLLGNNYLQPTITVQ